MNEREELLNKARDATAEELLDQILYKSYTAGIHDVVLREKLSQHKGIPEVGDNLYDMTEKRDQLKTEVARLKEEACDKEKRALEWERRARTSGDSQEKLRDELKAELTNSQDRVRELGKYIKTCTDGVADILNNRENSNE